MYLVMMVSDDIGDRPFVIVGCRIRALVYLEYYQVRVRLRRSVRIMYIAVCVRRGCAAEAKSMAQLRTDEKIGRGIYLGIREVGQNKQINLLP